MQTMLTSVAEPCTAQGARLMSRPSLLSEDCFELRCLHGFHHVQIKPCFEGLAPIVVLAPPRERNQHGVGAERQIANPPGRFQTVHARHAQVQEHEIRFEAGGLFDRFDPVVRRTNFVTHEFEQHR